MTNEIQQLDDAASRLARARESVIAPVASVPKLPAQSARLAVTLRRSRLRRAGHIDQLVAAGAAVVWIASFLQHAVNQVTDREDTF